VSGSGVICPGPGHSASDRSLSVTPSAAAPAGFLVHSFSPGDDPIACKDYVRARLGLSPFRPWQGPKAAPQRKPSHACEARQASDNAARALNIWRQAIGSRGTLIEQYLKSRALELPDEAANEAVRFLPDCHFGSERFPAMVCLVRNIVTNEPQGIPRTALAPDGHAIKRDGKTFRLTLGPIAGGAIKVDPDEDVTQGLCIGEGVETCLAGRQMGYRPVWAVLSAWGITGFPVLPGIDGLTIFGERDDRAQSEKAIHLCAGRWLEAGIETLTAWPLVGNDLNDEIKVAS
jgi:putative DNA primase/helicase